VVRADRLMHGKTTDVIHDGAELFEGVPSPLTVMRYHSLVIAPATVTPELQVCGWSSDRPAGQEIMAVRHRTRAVHGVQFHPESVGTQHGRTLISNFLRLAGYPLPVPVGAFA
jgi:anthranilate synthase/aminodeoxychorismate synthase-like glutamine amidotransferase